MIKLIKPWSIWTQPLQKDAIGYFKQYRPGIWTEFDGCFFGIGEETMKALLNSGYAVKV